MKIRELLESKYDYSLADYEATPYDTGFEHLGPKFAKYGEPNIGPQEGKYLNLMLKRMKPATIIGMDSEYKLFQPYLEDGTFSVAAKGDHSTVVTLPGEEWRGPKLLQLFDMLKNREIMSKDDLAKLESKIGMLLGIPKESIRYYLKTRIYT
jgi:hypothetical protein